MKVLVTGGASSGKTRRALALAEALGPQRVYVATAEAHDEEMRAKIARHRAERGAGWTTVEAPLGAAAALSRRGVVVLLDCLTLWLSNVMAAERPIDAEIDALVAALVAARNPVVLVTSEVGQGIVPDNALARRFREASGRVSQRVAAACDRVELVCAGLPLRLKG